jgi:hypothetical protein
MIEVTLADRLIAAYVQGADEQIKEIRGYGLDEDELVEVEREAQRLYA